MEASPLLEKFKSLQEDVHKKPRINVGRVVGGIFMTLGSIMLAVVVYLIYSNSQFAQRAIPVKGKVISYDSYREQR